MSTYKFILFPGMNVSGAGFVMKVEVISLVKS